MSNYAVEDRLTAEVVYAYTADGPDHTDVYPFATYNHILQKPPVAVDESRILSKLAYLREFSQAERIAIRTAAAGSPELTDYLELLALAEEVSKDDPDIIAALGMLEQAGLLAPGRAAEILA